jgi:hypothetical protein
VGGNHRAQLYRDDAFLTTAVCEFIRSGLTWGEGIAILATSAHRQVITQQLLESCIPFHRALSEGQVLFMDAHEALALVLGERGPDPEAFQNLICGATDDLKARFGRVGIYGELVDILCSRGKVEQALELEGLWNELLSHRPDCRLLCGYSMRNLASPDEVSSVLATHSGWSEPDEGRAMRGSAA